MYQETWVFKINPEQNFDKNNKRDQEKQQPKKMAASESRPIPGRTIKTWRVRRHRMNHRRKIWSRIHTALIRAFLYLRFLNKLLRSTRCQWELGGRFQILRNCVDIILTAAIRFRAVQVDNVRLRFFVHGNQISADRRLLFDNIDEFHGFLRRLRWTLSKFELEH